MNSSAASKINMLSRKIVAIDYQIECIRKCCGELWFDLYVQGEKGGRWGMGGNLKDHDDIRSDLNHAAREHLEAALEAMVRELKKLRKYHAENLLIATNRFAEEDIAEASE